MCRTLASVLSTKKEHKHFLNCTEVGNIWTKRRLLLLSVSKHYRNLDKFSSLSAIFFFELICFSHYEIAKPSWQHLEKWVKLSRILSNFRVQFRDTPEVSFNVLTKKEREHHLYCTNRLTTLNTAKTIATLKNTCEQFSKK